MAPVYFILLMMEKIMRKQEKTNHRQQKIDQLLALISGQITPKDISPRMVIYFNKESGDVHLVNNKPVDKNTFHTLLDTLPAIGPLVTHGRDDDDDAEYYYGDVQFNIYRDGREF